MKSKIAQNESVAKVTLLITKLGISYNPKWDNEDKKYHHYWSGNLIIPTL